MRQHEGSWFQLQEMDLQVQFTIPKGPSTQSLGTWDLGNSNNSTALGKYIIIGYLDP